MSAVLPVSGVAKNVQTGKLNASASGNTRLVDAPGATSKIRVLAVVLTSTLANTIKFQSETTDITATFPVGAAAGMVLPFTEHGWFDCAAGQPLNFNQSVATATGVSIRYAIIN